MAAKWNYKVRQIKGRGCPKIARQLPRNLSQFYIGRERAITRRAAALVPVLHREG